MTPRDVVALLGTLLVVVAGVWCVLVLYRLAALKDATDSEPWTVAKEMQTQRDYEREQAEWESAFDLPMRPVRLEPEAARRIMNKLFPHNPLYWATPSKAWSIDAESEQEAVRELVRSTGGRV